MEKCISDCHPKNEKYIHPNSLLPINENFDSCAIMPQERNNELIMSQKCDIKDKYGIVPILPTFFLSPLKFLGLYGITNFDELLIWLDKNNTLKLNYHYLSQIRNVEAGFKLLEPDEVDKLLDIRFINFCDFYFKKKINYIFEVLGSYIAYKNGEIVIVNNDFHANEYESERKNYIIDKFITSQKITNFISKIIIHKEFIERANKHKLSFTYDIMDNFVSQIIYTFKKMVEKKDK